MTTRTLGLFASVTLAAMAGLPTKHALAANDNGGPPAPPQEAIDSCANQSEGATCTLSFHGRSIEGTCAQGPGGNEPLACMPPPPPEAVEACVKLSEGATCTVSHHGRDMEGKCRLSPGGNGVLACAPPHPPRH
jgi:hypothetical protein